VSVTLSGIFVRHPQTVQVQERRIFLTPGTEGYFWEEEHEQSPDVEFIEPNASEVDYAFGLAFIRESTHTEMVDGGGAAEFEIEIEAYDVRLLTLVVPLPYKHLSKRGDSDETHLMPKDDEHMPTHGEETPK
jgi:hypothetical protein